MSQVRRQLEYAIAESKGIRLVKPPNTSQAVVDIVRSNGLKGLYTGFPLHLRMPGSPFTYSVTDLRHAVRDTSGTALYFLEYDGMRHLMGRLPSGEQGPTPSWLPIPASIVPFFCGSFSGVTSWALIYPLDV